MEQIIILAIKIIFWAVVTGITLISGYLVWKIDIKPKFKSKQKNK